jgi:lysyl-tRNA synthetase class 2
MSFAANWVPSASIAHLRQRQGLIARIRSFFNAREYLEVETPIMGRFGITDVYLSNIQATFRGQSYALQTSPEYHMKRLLAAGSGSIFQLARVFRDDELGRWHNPEFTLLEWYRLDVTHHDLMDEMDIFLQDLLASPPMIRKTYQQVFLEATDLDPLGCELTDLKACLAAHDLLNILPIDETCPDQYLFLLMSHVVEPFLSSLPAPVAVYDFPASQASLAKLNGAVAERFEVYYRGVELANGFHELTEASLQRDRFLKDNQIRKARGLPQNLPDEYLLEALQSGLPSCSGVALGVDRLLAIALKQSSIASVMSFDFSRS